MDINIIASCSNERNNEYIFSLLKNRDKTKNHIIIAPDRSLFSLEKRLFDDLEESCFFDVNVISLSRLSKKVIKNTTKKILTKQSGVSLVKKLLNDNKDKLKVFRKAINYMGFATSLFEMICLYKSCGISINDIHIDNSNTYSNLKQQDIKLIYTEYENYLQRDYTDSFNQLMLFADSINRETFKDTIFYFLEFDDFTRLMYNIIAKLSRFSDGIYVACTYGKENPNSDIYSNKVYYDLIDLFKGEALEYKVNKLSNFEETLKNNISNNLYAYKPSIDRINTDRIKIRNFENTRDEIKYTIADIYSHALTNKTSFSDYTLLLPSISDYKDIIMQEISKYDIPYYIDESECLKDNYLVRLIFDICNILDGGFTLSEYSNVIKSPLLNIDINKVNELDSYLKRIGAVGSVCLNADIVDDEKIKSFVNLVKTLSCNVKESRLARQYIDIVNEIYNYIIDSSQDFQNQLDSIQRRTFVQVNNRIGSINKDYLGVFGDMELDSFSDFIDVYKAYYESTNISLPPITSNTLFIADINVSYVNKNKYIYILGCNEGKMPSMQLDNGLVTDEEIAKMPNANKINPTIAMLNNRRIFKLFEANLKWTECLNISYCRSSGEGKAYPNTLVNSYLRLGCEDVSCSHILDVVSNSLIGLDSNNVIFNNLTSKVAECNLVNYLQNWNIYNSIANYRTIISSLGQVVSNKEIVNWKKEFKNIDLYSNVTNINFFKNNSTSVSQIECFYSCPYKHFLKYGVKLKDSSDYKLKPNDIGNIIHEVLKSLVPIIVDNREIDSTDVCQKAHDIMKDLLSTPKYLDIANNVNNAYIIKALYREINRVATAVLVELQASNFIPRKYEFYFSNIININGVGIKGFIDRIDETEDGFIVIDYKTGDNQFSNYNDVLSGKKLQLLIYSKAYQLLSKKKPAGAFYMPLSNGFSKEKVYSYKLNGVMLNTEDNIANMDKGLVGSDYKSKVVNLYTTSSGKIYSSSYYKNMCITHEEFCYLLDFAMKQVHRAIDRIIGGEISPKPLRDGNKSACDYCDYIAICRFANNNYCDVESVPNIQALKELGENSGNL